MGYEPCMEEGRGGKMSARVVTEGKPRSDWELPAIKNDGSTHPLSTPTHP